MPGYSDVVPASRTWKAPMKAYRFAKFLIQQRVVGFEVPDAPHFDSDRSTDWFLGQLARSNRYLEFGTGGSTYMAAKAGVDFVAVDSDVFFLAAVEKKIRAGGHSNNNQIFRHADIGLTGAWGRPVGHVSAKRLEKFRHYSDIPNDFASGPIPDLVLVDGRFRVACALKALNFLRTHDAEWKIVIDDYSTRPEYSAITEFADPMFVGRMAVLNELRSGSDISRLQSAIRRWEKVPI
jgi:hypothetical protein